MSITDTRPFCGQCGWKPDNSGLGDIGDDKICDSCGADLALYGFALEGPENPPSVPNANAGVEQVTFQWTASPASFPGGYDFRYNLDGGAYTIVSNATSPQVIPAAAGVEVCGSLRGYKNAIASDWSADDCATAEAAAATGADAGIPGVFTPSGSTIPADFAGMAGIIANPLTLWTVGQHVVLGDTSQAYWDGVAWQVGEVPEPGPTGFFTFTEANDHLSTPWTADLEVSEQYGFEVDVELIDWTPTTKAILFDNFDINNNRGQRCNIETTGSYKVEWNNDAFQFLSLVPSAPLLNRNVIRFDYDNLAAVDTISVMLNGAPDVQGDKALNGANKSNQGESLLLGMHRAQATWNIRGDVYKGTVLDAGVAVAVMDADDGGFPAGPVADGSTFTSNGRVWTVHGIGVSYTPPPPA